MAGLDVLQSQLDLVVADLLRRAAELGAAQNRDDVVEPLVLRGEPVDLGAENLPLVRQTLTLGVKTVVVRRRAARSSAFRLSPRRRQIVRSSASCRRIADLQVLRDGRTSRTHVDYCVAVGRTTRRAWTRDQSSPSNNAES